MINQETMTEDMAVIPTTQQRVSCNGGGGVLGHPLVWLTLGIDGKVEDMNFRELGIILEYVEYLEEMYREAGKL